MNSFDFVSTEHIIAEVTSMVDDTEFKKGFSRGWYVSRINDALRELSFDTKWLKISKTYDVPQNCQIKMPKGVFNLREIYVYNGETCTPSNSQVLHWKRTFDNKDTDGNGYLARIKDDGSNSNDVFLPNQSLNGHTNNFHGTKYYYNIENDLLMISASCRAFTKLRVKFNSNGGDIGDIPVIPQFFERAVVDYVEEKFWNAMKGRDPRKFRILWADAYDKLHDFSRGSWAKAKKRVTSMDGAERESINDYISSMYHK
jgi:hypothetical protein